MKVRSRLAKIGFLLLATLFWAAPAVSGEQAKTIPLMPPPGESGDGTGLANFLRVKAGEDGRAARVLLDTGSTGLRIRSKYIGKDVEVTSRPVTYTYAGSGNVLHGYLGYAKVYFPDANGLRTERRIAIHVVESIDCETSKPDCPKWRDGQAGVMGVAYYGPSAIDIYSPLLQLGGTLSDAYVIDAVADAPHIRVGPLSPSQNFSFAKLQPAAVTPPGRTVWDTWSAKVCWRLGGGDWSCKPTLFDSGAGSARFWPRGGINPHRLRGEDRYLESGLVSLKIDGVFSVKIEAGDTAYDDEFKIERKSGSQLGPNASGAMYRRFVVAFDNVEGRIGFCKPKNPLDAQRIGAVPCR